MSNTNRRQLLIRAWEEAVEGAIEDGIISLDEENALSLYLDHFGLTQEDLNRNGAQTTPGPGRGHPGRHPGHHSPAPETSPAPSPSTS